jgi:hypothetical protein
MTADNDPSPASAGTVLVVEDEVLLRLVISEYLRDSGYKVIEATNADEAIVVLQQPQLAVDVIFSDIEMPGSMDELRPRPVGAFQPSGPRRHLDRQRTPRGERGSGSVRVERHGAEAI